MRLLSLFCFQVLFHFTLSESDLVVDDGTEEFEDGLMSLEGGDYEDALRAFSIAVEKNGYQDREWQQHLIDTAKKLRSMAKSLGWVHNTTLFIRNGAENMSWVHGQLLREVIHPFLRTFHLTAEWEWLIQSELLKYEHRSGLPWVRAPLSPPPSLLPLYTLNGRIPVQDAYVDEGVSSFYEKFSRANIENFMEMARKREPGPHYRETDLALHKLLFERKDLIDLKDKRVMVSGSITPWYESVALFHGAGEVVTVEYNKLEWDGFGGKLKTVTHAEYIQLRDTRDARDVRDGGRDEQQKKRMKKTTQENENVGGFGGFDVAISISSFEHDGLGRYGDPLDPNGDLRAMFEISRDIKPKGLLILSVPVGADLMAFNCHRVYGPLRLPLLLQNFTLLYSSMPLPISRELAPDLNSPQPIFLLRNERPEQEHQF